MLGASGSGPNVGDPDVSRDADTLGEQLGTVPGRDVAELDYLLRAQSPERAEEPRGEQVVWIPDLVAGAVLKRIVHLVTLVEAECGVEQRAG